MSAWSSRPSSRWRFSAAIPTTSPIPRYDLDFALFRVYENGVPLRPEHFLKWNAKGAAENELVFVTGHPGSTDRNDTVAELETLRDVIYPSNIQVVKTARRRPEAIRGGRHRTGAPGRGDHLQPRERDQGVHR